ncbi:TM2 domain protein [Pseudovibrio axinellae]|uniref:TM2 domain protein n=1 Tax=Pseudovibrio axinellae TaxID=989403 RepID=A0A165X3M8_9HYPH|nr:TM2 domain-containing protein [Pseudovibrio axinellae]KZL17321.1 TM2 domain protein [Pseudovibrio axinellae]SEQ20213.1 TM2 domain-containing protein [Pseudovibrio axinellae]
MNKANYFMQLKALRDTVSADKREEFDMLFAGKEKNPVVALVLGLFLGSFGIDRFYCSQVVLGILKLITLGGLGIWTLIDWFLIMGAARRRNLVIASETALFVK